MKRSDEIGIEWLGKLRLRACGIPAYIACTGVIALVALLAVSQGLIRFW